MTDRVARDTLATALALALGAAVSLGLARFSYALLLPPMRGALGWTYFTAGAMGTANAAGYLAGALITPRLIAAAGARGVCLVGMFVSGALLMGHGLAAEVGTLYALRAASGLASAAVFVSGGLMAARLSLRDPLGAGMTPGLVLGLYYGGTGWGIVASALIVAAPEASPASWRDAWRWLGVVSLLAAAVMLWRSQATLTRAVASQAGLPFAARPFAFALAAYLMFGLGYIGYMTFIVTLLREQGLSTQAVSAFFALLGIGVAASPFIWAGLLQRHRDGRPLATLNALLVVASLLPVLWPGVTAAFASAVLFGGVFLSVVAATTALVRHNLPDSQWAAGVGAFTVVFAVGQILGPSAVGMLADSAGGLRAGLGASALVLLVGAGLATRQRALAHP